MDKMDNIMIFNLLMFLAVVVIIILLVLILVKLNNKKICNDNCNNVNNLNSRNNFVSNSSDKCTETAGYSTFATCCEAQDKETKANLTYCQGTSGGFCIPDSSDPLRSYYCDMANQSNTQNMNRKIRDSKAPYCNTVCNQ